jgi:hypothetical protein
MAKTPETPAVKKPRVSVLERRLQNPFGMPSEDIPLKDRSMIARWFNAKARPNRHRQAGELGWIGVTPEMLADQEQAKQFRVSVNGYVCQGEREEEILMFMPKDDYWKIQKRKAQLNTERMKRPGATKAEVVGAAGQALGDQAGSALNSQMRVVGEISDSYERVERLAVEE